MKLYFYAYNPTSKIKAYEKSTVEVKETPKLYKAEIGSFPYLFFSQIEKERLPLSVNCCFDYVVISDKELSLSEIENLMIEVPKRNIESLSRQLKNEEDIVQSILSVGYIYDTDLEITRSEDNEDLEKE